LVFTTFSELDRPFEQAVGEVTFDLRSLPWTGETVKLVADLGLGSINVAVPPTVAITGRGEVGLGLIELMGEGSVPRFGASAIRDFNLAGGNGTLVLDLEVGSGQIRVIRSDTDVTSNEVGVGDIDVSIADESQIRDYRLGFGDVALDLGGLVLTEDRTMQVLVGFGDITVLVNDQMPLQVEATSGLGSVVILGEATSSLPGEFRNGLPGPTLTLELRTGAGQVVVEGFRR
jgi:predicted membrane protein